MSMAEGSSAEEKIRFSELGSAAEKLCMAKRLLDRIPALLYSLSDEKDETSLTALKAGTMVLFSLLGKLVSGKSLRDLTDTDWADIAANVIDHAVLMDGRQYTVVVFETYAGYIELCVQYLKQWQSPTGEGFPKEKLKAIENLAWEIRHKTKELRANKISEPDYVEDCLWLCLEAMIKQLSLWLGRNLSAEFSELGQAVSILAFEYGRYRLYAKEQALLAEYLAKQEQLDAELQKQYDEFMAEVQAYSEQFMSLVDNAFAPDFRPALTDSVALAQAAGVADAEILVSVEDVDDFFIA